MGCGACGVCRRGDENLCLKPASIGVFRDGGYSDFLMVPHPRYLFDIGDMPPERAAPLACSGVTTYSALKKVGPTLATEPVVIIGAGGLGLMCLALHKAMGGHSAIVVDIDPVKREAAKKAGARAVIDGGAPDAVAQVIAATGGGAWAVIDLVGSSATARLGLDSLIKGGKLIIVGLYGGDITLSLPPFPMRAITVQGSYVGSLTETAELIELVRRTGLPRGPGRDAAAVGRQRGARRAARRQGDRPRGADARHTTSQATPRSRPRRGAGGSRLIRHCYACARLDRLERGWSPEQMRRLAREPPR